MRINKVALAAALALASGLTAAWWAVAQTVPAKGGAASAAAAAAQDGMGVAVEVDGALKIARKTCVLDMEALRPHARISIIL